MSEEDLRPAGVIVFAIVFFIVVVAALSYNKRVGEDDEDGEQVIV